MLLREIRTISMIFDDIDELYLWMARYTRNGYEIIKTTEEFDWNNMCQVYKFEAVLKTGI